MSAETSIKGIDSILSQIDAKKIFEDKEFLEKLSKAKTPEEIIELFKTKGITLSLEQVQEIAKRGEKLTEADLENISGVVNKKAVIAAGAIIGATVLTGLGIVAGAPHATGKYRERKKEESIKKFVETRKNILQIDDEMQSLYPSHHQ